MPVWQIPCLNGVIVLATDFNADQLAALQIIQFSPYPPPLGGNSIHVQRMVQRCNAAGLACLALDYTGTHIAQKQSDPLVLALQGNLRQRLRQLRTLAPQLSPNRVVHMHVSMLRRFRYLAPYLLWIFRRQRVWITIHSGRFVAQNSAWQHRVYLKWLFRKFERIITVNTAQLDFLRTLGLRNVHPTSLPAFVAPTPSTVSLPADIAHLANTQQLVVAAGSLTTVYGFDVLLDAFSAANLPDVRLICAFYGPADDAVAAEIHARIAQLPQVSALTDSSPALFQALLQQAAVYVRPTRTDGDAVTIREALALGLPVIASDCVTRPTDCQLFETDNVAALAQTLTAVLADAPVGNREAMPDYAAALLALYQTDRIHA